MKRILPVFAMALGLALPTLAAVTPTAVILADKAAVAAVSPTAVILADQAAAPVSPTAVVQADAAANTTAAEKPKKVKKAKKHKPAGAYGSPDFTLTEVATGKKLTLSDLAGKVVILDFWATWCPPCRAEIPHFIDIQKEYGDKGVQVLGVSLDQDGPPVVKPFMQRFGINYPIVVDNGQVAMAYGGIRGIPTTFLLGKNGEKLGQWVGYNDKAVFESAVREALAR